MVERSEYEDAKCVDPGAFLLAFLLISPEPRLMVSLASDGVMTCDADGTGRIGQTFLMDSPLTHPQCPANAIESDVFPLCAKSDPRTRRTALPTVYTERDKDEARIEDGVTRN